MSKPFDYSKWDKIELSDDEDDVHPNIDRESWFRMKHRSRVEREENEAKDRKNIEQEVRGGRVRVRAAAAAAASLAVAILVIAKEQRKGYVVDWFRNVALRSALYNSLMLVTPFSHSDSLSDGQSQ
jgi:cell division cycle protein 37